MNPSLLKTISARYSEDQIKKAQDIIMDLGEELRERLYRAVN